MKTEFELNHATRSPSSWRIKIVGTKPKSLPYVSIWNLDNVAPLFIQDKDLERFAINILKALKSKHLKT